MTLQVQCGGPIGGMTVTADSKGEVKGYVHNPDVMLPPKNGKLDVGGALGPGFLNVIKDMGLKEPYSGQTILQTGEIAEDLTYYFATSEQVPSSVGLGVLMEKDNTVRCDRWIYRTGDDRLLRRKCSASWKKTSRIFSL